MGILYKSQKNYTDLSVLCKELNKGSEEAFDYLFRTRYRKLCIYAATVVGSHDTARDIVQEVFSVIWLKCTVFKQEASIDTYLYAAVRNKCIDNIKLSERTIAIGTREFRDTEPDLADELEHYSLIMEWVNKLPAQRKAIFQMIVFEGMKYKEAAGRLDLSINTVKTQIKIAYSSLKKYMRDRAEYADQI